MNPQTGFWEMLVPAISSRRDDSVEPISFESWFEALKATASGTNDGPAIKGGSSSSKRIRLAVSMPHYRQRKP